MICQKCNKSALMLFADGNCKSCQPQSAPVIQRKIKSTPRTKWANENLCCECKTRIRLKPHRRCLRCLEENARVMGRESKACIHYREMVAAKT